MRFDWQEDWMAWLRNERRYPENTLLAYQRDLDDYDSFLQSADASAMPPERALFRRYLAALQQRGLARTTIARRISKNSVLIRTRDLEIRPAAYAERLDYLLDATNQFAR